MKTQQYQLKHLSREYRERKGLPIVFDFREASTQLLKYNHNRDNRYFQYIHYYPGRIYPYIPLYILSSKDFEHFDGYLLDPFAGSGTILLESIVNPVIKRNSIGVEINPLGRLISKVKTTVLNFGKIEKQMQEIRALYSSGTGIKDHVPSFKNRDLWFSPNATKKLARLRFAIDNLGTTRNYKDFFWVCFSVVIRKVAKADPYIPPPVVLKPEKYRDNPHKYERLKNFLKQAETPDVWGLFEGTVKSIRTKLEALKGFQELKSGIVKAEIIWDDARSIKRGSLSQCGRIKKGSFKKLSSNSVDLIFTSPPYLTAQKYIRTNRLELLWLGYSEEVVNDLEKTSIGTERVSAELEVSPVNVKPIDSLIDYTFSKSHERGLTVYKYFKDMIEALNEMHRLLKKDGYAILVVGNNKVLKKKVDTYRLLTEVAINLGFKEIVTLKDKIRGRSMMTKRNGTGGLIKDEYVIVLKKEA